MKKLFITGGAGFIGSNFVQLALAKNYSVVVLDSLTYAGYLGNLVEFESNPNFTFVKVDIRDRVQISEMCKGLKPSGIVHFAAESHVDNSISGPSAFIQSNIIGTFELLEAVREYIQSNLAPRDFRFLHVSTDEVYGALDAEGFFTESSQYAPNSPYSASKASSDLLVRAWHKTYGLPVVTTNCSNNYGPKQFPEKLIPKTILSALKGLPITVYGQGQNIRDWIYVGDHAQGVCMALEKGQLGETYLFGGGCEVKNIEVVNAICSYLEKVRPRSGKPYRDLIQFVPDRLGHDFRYAIDDSKAVHKLGFKRQHSDFVSGLEQTIDWYIRNTHWLDGLENRSSK